MRVNMPNYKGLKDLYHLFKNAINQNQEFLDPDNAGAKYPKVMGVFQYTHNFKYFHIRGDTNKEAMVEFCSLYDKKVASGKEINNLLDTDILTFDGKTLLLAEHNAADGLCFILKWFLMINNLFFELYISK